MEDATGIQTVALFRLCRTKAAGQNRPSVEAIAAQRLSSMYFIVFKSKAPLSSTCTARGDIV